jgi:hypothetical protein
MFSGAVGSLSCSRLLCPSVQTQTRMTTLCFPMPQPKLHPSRRLPSEPLFVFQVSQRSFPLVRPIPENYSKSFLHEDSLSRFLQISFLPLAVLLDSFQLHHHHHPLYLSAQKPLDILGVRSIRIGMRKVPAYSLLGKTTSFHFWRDCFFQLPCLDLRKLKHKCGMISIERWMRISDRS